MANDKRRISIRCGTCGGSNVMRDAWAVWSDEAQDWELGAVFDDGACEDCGGQARLVEIEI